jgi:hypothetical protein
MIFQFHSRKLSNNNKKIHRIQLVIIIENVNSDEFVNKITVCAGNKGMIEVNKVIYSATGTTVFLVRYWYYS